MGSHRGDRRGPRRPSTAGDVEYIGRRVAGRETAAAETAGPASAAVLALAPVPALQPTAARPVTTTGTHRFDDLTTTSELPLVLAPPRPVQPAGRRRAERHFSPRGPLFTRLPSVPAVLGLATLAVAVGGGLSSREPAPVAVQTASVVRPASALGGTSGIATSDLRRGAELSRSSDRQALQQASGSELVEAAEAQVIERNAALGNLAVLAEKQAQREENQWVLPLDPSIITATFGEYGLWSSYHTGLDFNGNTGDSIHAIAAGVVTSTGYDGAYGNKTVVTLEDGTELWYCHQTTILVGVGDVVAPDEVIGTVGTTGNVTGSHLHVEVRPGGGDPVDPYPAFVVHGVTP